MGSAIVTGAANVAVGSSCLGIITAGVGNTAIGHQAGQNLTTGGSNILLGANSAVSVATISNELVIGSSGNFVGTDAAANTFFTSATALSTGVLPVTCGFMKINLNGTIRKIAVYAV